MDREHSLVREDIDQDVQRPAKHFQHRPSNTRPHQSKDHGKHQQTMTAMIELPDELKVLWTVSVGQ